VAIQAEVENLRRVDFIYPIPLTKWVSNIVPVTKKQGTIRVCVDYRDLNKACPKYNYPTPFIDQIIDNCVGSCYSWNSHQAIFGDITDEDMSFGPGSS